MKTSKKVLSVILTVAMIMTTISVCFVSFAAGSVTDSTIAALVDALKKDTVANATYNVSNNKTTVIDPNGDIIAAAKIYYQAFKECADVRTSGDNHTSTYRTSSQVKSIIQTKVQGVMGSTDVQNYNVLSVLNAFNAGCEMDDSTNSQSALTPATATVEITLSDSFIEAYETLADLPETVEKGYTMSFTHQDATYSVADRCGSTTYHFIRLSKIDESSAGNYDFSSLTALEDAINNYADLKDVSKEAMVSLDSAYIAAAYNDITSAYENAKTKTSATAVAHFFDVDALDAKLADVEYAYNIQLYIPIVENIEEVSSVDYSEFTVAEAEAHYNTIKSAYDSFKALDQDVQDALVAITSFDTVATEAYITAVFDYIEVAKITAFKATVDADKADFDVITEADVVDGAVTKAQLNADLAKIRSDIQSLNSYKAANVAAVCGADYMATLDETVDHLMTLITVEDYNAKFVNKYTYFLNTVQTAIDLDADSEELLAALQGIDGWYAELNAFEAELAEAVGAETAALIVKDLSEQMHAKIDAQYAVLEARVDAEIDVAKNIYDGLVALYGDEVNMSTFAGAKKMAQAFESVETDAYAFLDASENYTVSAELKAKYDAVAAYVDEYNDYVRTGGFNKFNKVEIADIIREVTSKDVVRNEDYTVTDSDVEALLGLVDRILNSEELGLNLSDTISGLKDTIYSDATVNALVKLLFPMVTDLLVKTLTTMIPPTVHIANDDNPGIPDIVKGKDVEIKLPSMLSIAQNAGLLLFPTQLVDSVRAEGFTAVADVLAQVTTDPKFEAKKAVGKVTEKTLEDGSTVKVDSQGNTLDDNGVYVLDAEGNYVDEVLSNPWYDDVLYDEEGNLALEWGIEGKDDFVNALASLLGFLEPVLAAVLGDQAVKLQRNLSTAKVKNSSGRDVASNTVVIKAVALNIDFSIDILHVVLKIGDMATGKGANLYNDVLVPVFELLGVSKDNIADGKTFKPTLQNGLGVASTGYATTKTMLNAILNPVEKVLDNLAASPAEFLADVLPNLAYAVESGSLMNLINNIKLILDVKLGTPANQSDAVSALGGMSVGWVLNILGVDKNSLYEAFGLDMFIDGFESPMTLKIAELIDLDNLEINGQKLDLTLNGILNLVIGLLAEGVTLPAMDGATLAQLGDLVQIDTGRNNKAYEWGEEGKAAHINANRADVLIFLVKYILDAATTEGFIDNIVAALAGEDSEPVELPAIVMDILANVAANKDDAIAAIMELVNPKEYEPKPEGMTWRDPIPASTTKDIYDEDGNVIGTETTDLVQYSEDWTEAQAKFVAKHLPIFIDDILLLFGVKIGDVAVTGLRDLVDKAINDGLYTTDTITTLLDALKGLGLDDTIKGILNDMLGIDLSAWDNIDPTIAAGDSAAFAAKLVEILNPIAPVLAFILADEDIEIKLTDADGKFTVVKALGNEGYSYGLVPLLESLGAEGVLPTAQFIADKDNIVANVVNPIVSVLDKVVADPYAAVQTLVPNLLYFLASDGLKVALDNLLYPVYQLLDTIRPIYDVNLKELIPFDLDAFGSDPVAALITMLTASVEESTGVSLDIDYTIDDIFELLSFGDVETYTSANGDTVSRIVNKTDASADMITVLLRYIFGEVLYSENAVLLADAARAAFNLDDAAFAALYSLLYSLRYMPDGSVDKTLNVISYIFYGIDTAVNVVAVGYDFYSYDWINLYNMLLDSEVKGIDKVGAVFEATYKTAFKVIYDDYSRQRLNDALDNLPIDEDTKKKTNFILDFINMIIQKMKDLIQTIKDAFHIG